MASLVLTIPRPARDLYFPEVALAGLRALGEVRLNDSDCPWTPSQLIAAAQGCEVVVSDRQTPGPPEIFDALPSLVAFVRAAVDIRNVEVEAASRLGILVTRATPGFVPAVAELVLGCMIDLARGIGDATMAYRSGRAPEIAMGRQLDGSVLGVIGYGAIGQRLADLGLALRMQVIASDPHVDEVRPGVQHVDLPTLLERADFVVCLAPANEATENLMDAAAFQRMRPGAYFINASRGNLVDESALAAVLDSGHLAGAAMDVGRAPDQMPTPALAAHPRVIATPHIGGLTPPAVAHQALETVCQSAAILQGEVPPGAVNATHAGRLARFANGRDSRPDGETI